MTIDQLIAQNRTEHAQILSRRAANIAELAQLRAKESTTHADAERAENIKADNRAIDTRADHLDAKLAEYQAAKAEDAATDARSAITVPGAASPSGAAFSTGATSTTRATAGQWIRTHDRQPAVVERGQRFAEHPVVSASERAADQHVIGQHGSLGQMVRAMSTTSGSAIVPTTWAGDIIDRARNIAAVLKAGAQIVPMDAGTVKIGRLTGDPTAAFRTEGSTITASDPTFDNVTLSAKTMSCLVVGNLEWFQDADNADQVVMDAIAQAFALQLDLVSLYGGTTSYAGGAIDLATPPNPRGVLAALSALASSSVLGGSTNGTTQTAASYYNELIDLIYTPQDYNETPNALIWNSKAARQYAKAYDSTYQPLRAPQAVSELPQFVSNQIPSYTQGTMTSRATDVFVGDWSQLLIGQRLDMTIQTLTERYAENGQVGIVAHWRGDVQPARPRAFAAYKAIQGAS